MATNLDINTKLVDISTQYSKFNKNQVLTETQLNGFLDYFDDQDRLTRTSLSGVGIVCGFKVILQSRQSQHQSYPREEALPQMAIWLPCKIRQKLMQV